METIEIKKEDKKFKESLDICREIIKENSEYIKDYIVIKYSDFLILGLNDDQNIVSFLSVTEDEEYDNIAQIAVKNEYKKKGYGTMMIDHLKEVSDNIMVEINDQNLAAQSFFENNGFKLNETDYGIKATFDRMYRIK